VIVGFGLETSDLIFLAPDDKLIPPMKEADQLTAIITAAGKTARSRK
jgi:hypothetical protein